MIGWSRLVRSRGGSSPSITIVSSNTWQLSDRPSCVGRLWAYCTQSHRLKLRSPERCRNRTGKSRLHCRSIVTPAQQTVSPYRRLGCGSALTNMTTRSDDVAISPRLVDEEIADLRSPFGQRMSDERSMTCLRLALETQETSGLPTYYRRQNRYRLPRSWRPEMRTVYTSKIVIAPSASSFSACLRVAEVLQVQIRDALTIKSTAKGLLREAKFSRERDRTNVDQDLDARIVQGFDKSIDIGSLVADREYDGHRAHQNLRRSIFEYSMINILLNTPLLSARTSCISAGAG